jgi:adenylate cyclase
MKPLHEDRRLTTILAADVVGYSRLMANDESATLAVLKVNRKEIMEPKTLQYHGRVVKLMGDGTLMEFSSVIDAVNFAVDVQIAMAERNATVSDDIKIIYRIGINVGDIIVEGDDIYGDGVNIAARLEQLADPGGICISRNVYNHIKNKLDIPFQDMGKVELKNIPEAVRAYQFVGTNLPDKSFSSVKQDEPLALPDKPSVAVLPFDNLSGDPEQEYFADGLTEDIITELSRFMSLFVIARNSTFALKGQSLEVKEVGRKLGVRYVVEGSVRRAGNRIRITAQLIDASNDTHLWAERYDRDLEDIFSVQDEVTLAIVTAIEPHLESTERERARRKPPENLGAWECHQRGLWHLYQHTADDSAKGEELFRRAIKLDPGFAAPHTALAFLLYYQVMGGLVSDPGDRLTQALEEARSAVAANEWDAFGHEVLGRILLLFGQHDAAIAAHKTSLKLNPNYANAHYGLAFAMCFTGQPDEAIRELDKAQRLSPHDPLLWAFFAIKSFALTLLRRYDEALDFARMAQQWPNATVWAYFTAVVPLAHLGRLDEAREAFAQALAIKPDLSPAYFQQIFNFKNATEMRHIMDGLYKAGLEQTK